MRADRHITLLTVALLCATTRVVAQQQVLSLTLEKVPGELEVKFGPRRLLLYAFASNQFKPYVREFYALNGFNVLCDAPADHLHHHGLMYAIR